MRPWPTAIVVFCLALTILALISNSAWADDQSRQTCLTSLKGIVKKVSLTGVSVQFGSSHSFRFGDNSQINPEANQIYREIESRYSLASDDGVKAGIIDRPEVIEFSDTSSLSFMSLVFHKTFRDGPGLVDAIGEVDSADKPGNWFKLVISKSILDPIENGYSNKSFSQAYDVDFGCNLHLVGTSLEKDIVTPELGKIWVYQVNDNNGLVSETNKSVMADSGLPFSSYEDEAFNLLYDPHNERSVSLKDQFERIKMHQLIEAGTAGPFRTGIGEIHSINFWDPDTLKSETMNVFDLKVSSADSDYVFSQFLSATRFGSLGSTTITVQVQPSTWMASDILNEKIESQIVTKNLEKVPPHSKMLQLRLQSDIPLDIHDLRRYWYVTQEPEFSKFQMSKKLSYILTAREPYNLNVSPKISNANPEAAVLLGESLKYLKGSSVVQLDAPELQLLLQEVRAKTTKNSSRLEIVRVIRDVLKDHIHYALSRLFENGKVEEMTTGQILQLQSGTCANFANVFAALARSFGIPAKIEVGLSLSMDGRHGYHAWNEVDLGYGYWVPIEPQDTDHQMDTSYYIPLKTLPNDLYSDPEGSRYGLVNPVLTLLKVRPIVKY